MAKNLTPEDQDMRRRLLMELLGDLPDSFGPMPPDRWGQLPAHQRDWLSGKSKAELEQIDDFIRAFDKDDIARIKQTMKLADDLQTFGKYTRILVMAAVAVFIGAVTLGENVFKVVGWLKGAPRP